MRTGHSLGKSVQKILWARSPSFGPPLMTLYNIANLLFLIFGTLAIISFHICLNYGFHEYQLTEKHSTLTILRHASYHPMFLITLILSFTSVAFLVVKFGTCHYYYCIYVLIFRKVSPPPVSEPSISLKVQEKITHQKKEWNGVQNSKCYLCTFLFLKESLDLYQLLLSLNTNIVGSTYRMQKAKTETASKKANA